MSIREHVYIYSYIIIHMNNINILNEIEIPSNVSFLHPAILKN